MLLIAWNIQKAVPIIVGLNLKSQEASIERLWWRDCLCQITTLRRKTLAETYLV